MKIERVPDAGSAARTRPSAGETIPAPIARCGARKKKRTPRKARPKGIVRNMRTIRSRTRTAAAIPAIATRGPSTIAGGAPRAITPDGTAGFDKAVSGNPSGRPKPLSGGSSLARPGQERLGPPRPQVRSLDARPPPRAEARTVPSREGDPDEVPAEGGRGRRGHRERARVLDDPDGGAPRARGAGVRRGPLGGDARGPPDPPREGPEARPPSPAVVRGPAPAARPLRGLRVPRVRPP